MLLAMPPSSDVIGAIGHLLQPLLETLERVLWVQRHLFPPLAGNLAEELAPCGDAVAGPLSALEKLEWPDDLQFMRDRLVDVSRQTVDLVTAFVDAARSPDDPIDLFRALRRFARIQETLYPLAPAFEPVSRWFLEPARRDDDALVARLREGALRDDEVRVGVLHASNERDARGGFSVYVPEDADGRTPMPLVVALHGGHGHGRDFLWSWVADARSRGVLLMAPTSRDRTWSIMGMQDVDAEGMRHMVESVADRYPVDRSRVLLTGMSDGATYALLCGLRDSGAPFTHLAPACGVLHPFLFAGGGLEHAAGRPVYMIHGALDWMFPVSVAHLGRDALQAAGARLVYREIEDLSHTYPRDENPKILDWLTSDDAAPTA
ncbi:MAG: phospholipase [Candidatus Rokuibacteriota bacterium]